MLADVKLAPDNNAYELGLKPLNAAAVPALAENCTDAGTGAAPADAAYVAYATDPLDFTYPRDSTYGIVARALPERLALVKLAPDNNAYAEAEIPPKELALLAVPAKGMFIVTDEPLLLRVAPPPVKFKYVADEVITLLLLATAIFPPPLPPPVELPDDPAIPCGPCGPGELTTTLFTTLLTLMLSAISQ